MWTLRSSCACAIARKLLTRQLFSVCSAILTTRHSLLHDGKDVKQKSIGSTLTSTTRYPQWFATTCARVVFPSPGGPQSKSTCKIIEQWSQMESFSKAPSRAELIPHERRRYLRAKDVNLLLQCQNEFSPSGWYLQSQTLVRTPSRN